VSECVSEGGSVCRVLCMRVDVDVDVDVDVYE
jgi:hypothetical protein